MKIENVLSHPATSTTQANTLATKGTLLTTVDACSFHVASVMVSKMIKLFIHCCFCVAVLLYLVVIFFPLN